MRQLTLFLLVLSLGACGGSSGSVTSSGGGSSGAVVTTYVSLSWNAASGTVQGYRIDDSTDGVNYTQVKTVTGSTTTSTTVSGLPEGYTYYFKVRAFNQGGNSAYTSAGSVSL